RRLLPPATRSFPAAATAPPRPRRPPPAAPPAPDRDAAPAPPSRRRALARPQGSAQRPAPPDSPPPLRPAPPLPHAAAWRRPARPAPTSRVNASLPPGKSSDIEPFDVRKERASGGGPLLPLRNAE